MQSNPDDSSDQPVKSEAAEDDLPNEKTSLINNNDDDFVPQSDDLKKSLPSGIEEVSIYDVRSRPKCKFILAAASLTLFLVPFCETIYLPSIQTIALDLNTTTTLVAVSMAVYFVMIALSGLVWGCVADRFGRKKTMIVSLIIFTVATIGCIFTPDIAVFIVCRGVQGATISTTLVVGQAIIADTFPKSRRGFAVAIFFVPFTLGPVIGPLIGGLLSHYYSWRVCFIFLSSYSVFVSLILLFFVPETHQYYVKEEFNKANPTKRITDAEPNELLPFQKPWRPLIYLGDLKLIPYIVVMSTTFATLYSSLTLFSIFLSRSPYDYSQLKIGILYIPGGVAMFCCSVIIGWLSDKAAQYYGRTECPEGRLVPGLSISVLHPIGLLIYGWTYEFKQNIGAILVGFILLGVGQSALEPSASAYLTVVRQEEPGAVAAANAFLMTMTAGIFLAFTVPLEQAMTSGPYFSLMAGINFVAIGAAFTPVIQSIKRAAREKGQQNGSNESFIAQVVRFFKQNDKSQYQSIN